MATTVTSTHRGTSSLAVAPTQNTAPVHEFRCLYTRDLHKKTKKWHDGSLRFHTFNRRVMVYDDAKNYIGDLHYTQDEDFAEGVEIQLDRGVKVEVGERLGETQTDLAPILERQRPEKAVPEPRQPTHLTARPQSTGFSQRPKSLLEVLGPSQGRLGRSRLPLQSPYEQRQPIARSEPAQPPAKRRRLSSDKENQAEIDTPRTRPSQTAVTKVVRSTKTTLPSSHRREDPVVFEEVLDISSDEEPPRPRHRGAEQQQGQRKIAKKPKEKTKSSSEPTKARRATTQKAVRSSCKTGPPKSVLNKHQGAPENQQSTVSAAATTSRSSVQLTARLLLSQPKPRTKLTCVLPFERAPSMKGTAETRTDDPRARGSNDVDPATSEGAGSRSRDQESEPNSNEGRRSPTQISSSRTSSPEGSNHSSHICSSPLFLPEDTSRHSSPTPKPLWTQEDILFPDFATTGLSPSSARQQQSQDNVSNRVDGPNTHRQGDSGSDTVAVPLRTVAENDAAQEDFSRPPAVPPHVDDTTARTFRRVLSDNDAMDNDGLGQGSVLSGVNRSPLKSLDNLKSRPRPAMLKTPTMTHRCASDTATMDNQLGGLVRLDSPDFPKGEVGPWTAEEAFLLFDWWPPDKEKPSFWDAHMDKPSAQTVVSGPGRGCHAGITTARQFLRDDVDAL